MALRNLNVEHEVVGIFEIDKFALKSYEAIHGDCPNLGDITTIKGKEVPDHDLFTYSFPCFVEGTKILTLEGFKNIEEVSCNDYVLTHNNRYEKVVKPMINEANKLYRISTMPSDDIYVTEEHPFYVREKYREWNNARRSYDRKFKPPAWVKAKDLTKDFYVGVAINNESEIPNWSGSTFKWSDGRKERYSNEINCKFNASDFWWLIGRYIGDGWIRHQGGIIICCDFEETTEITEKLEILNINYSISSERTTNKIHVSMTEIGEYVEQFGRGAKNKRLTGDIFNLPKHLLKGFLDGYMSADGCFTNGINKATSVSSELIYGIGQCVAKVYNVPFSVYKTERPSTCVIEGRTVNQLNTYQITWKNEKKKQDKAFYEDGYIWCPINKIEDIEYDGLVYNIEVENDNSYVVQNIIVHNCQDLSVAGNQKGLGEGTRSGLLYECEKIIEAKKPKYLLLENVKNLVGKKFKGEFDKWLEYLEGLGYVNYWQVLNAKNYGVPQNRERVFVVSILNDTQGYEFPSTVKLDKVIRDILENDVDEKYYMNKSFKLVDKGHIAELQMRGSEQINRVYSKESYSPCLNTMQGGHREPKILMPQVTQQDIRRIEDDFRVRKLTPLECWRLMSFSDDDFYKAKNAGMSNSQLYKQAGNSIVVKVLEGIFKNMLMGEVEMCVDKVVLAKQEVEQLKWIM